MQTDGRPPSVRVAFFVLPTVNQGCFRPLPLAAPLSVDEGGRFCTRSTVMSV